MGAVPAARILVVDDDESILQLVTDTLTREGYIVSSAVSPAAALNRATQVGSFRLVVSDVHLPEMTGFQMRDALRKIDGHEKTPFLFMSAGYEAVENDIATLLGDAPLLLKPFTRSDLRRMVYKALKFVRVVVGPIPGQLDRVFEDVADAQGTGILTAVDGATVKRVVFQDGKAVFAASNDPRDLIGQAYIRAGLISEKELLAAFERKEAGPVPGKPMPALAGALAALRKVTPEQSAAVFQQKTRESILDLYLWSKGALEYSEGNVTDADLPFPISVELAPLRVEGALRRKRWAAVMALFPDTNVAFERTGKPLPAGFPKTGGEKALVSLIDEGRTLAEILLEMRGQDYAVGMRLASMRKAEVLRTGPPRGFRGPREDTGDLKLPDEFETMFGDLGSELADGPPAVAASPAGPVPASAPLGETSAPRVSPEMAAATASIFATALVKMRAGDFAGARAGLEEVLSLDPMSALARERLKQVESSLAEKSRDVGLEDGRELALAVRLEDLVGRQMPAADAFVLSRLAAGKVTVGQLLRLCPFPPHEVLGILEKHLAGGVLR